MIQLGLFVFGVAMMVQGVFMKRATKKATDDMLMRNYLAYQDSLNNK